MNRSLRAVATALCITAALPAAALAATESRVDVGSPHSPFPQNKQNEPAVARDATHPSVLAAGSNDEIDLGPCGTAGATASRPCPFTTGVGVSGVYFSLDSGKTWVQPTYTGFSARTGTPGTGPIGTLPGYDTAGLVSGGDPALAFGPVPDAHGHFSWANGSRLYYANLTANFSATRSDQAFKGFEAVAVSRTDDVAAAAANDQSAWKAPVIVSKQSSATFSDKEQIWADNASSSPFFGHAYTCIASFRSKAPHTQANAPQPLIVATSTDGGGSWRNRQVTSASTDPNGPSFGNTGCTVRTDSHGVVYVFYERFDSNLGPLPPHGDHFLIKSFNGGRTFTRPRRLFGITDPCFVVDPVEARCVFDGNAGTRSDLSASPSVDIANGAPTGSDATNEIVDAYSDGGAGLNAEVSKLTYSTNGGATFSSPHTVSQAGDRSEFTAPAIAPDGSKVYVAYVGFTTPFQSDTSAPREMLGVLRSAPVGAGGAPGTFTTVNRGASGDARGSSSNSLAFEFIGDYAYAAATRDYGVGIWTDSRNAVDCPAIDAYRQSLFTSNPSATPFPPTDCPAGFGDTDIYSATTAP